MKNGVFTAASRLASGTMIEESYLPAAMSFQLGVAFVLLQSLAVHAKCRMCPDFISCDSVAVGNWPALPWPEKSWYSFTIVRGRPIFCSTLPTLAAAYDMP